MIDKVTSHANIQSMLATLRSHQADAAGKTIAPVLTPPTPEIGKPTFGEALGQSMVVDALSLVLGGRASPELVRAGSKEAEVEALFDLEKGSRAASLLEEWGVPQDGEVVVRRVVAQEGRSRAYLNGRLVTAAQLAELGGELADIASQHESVRLTDDASHL